MGLEAIIIGLFGITAILAYFSRNTEQDFLKGLFGTLAVYMLIALSNSIRIIADEIVNNNNLAEFLTVVYIISLLLALFITFYNFYILIRSLLIYIKNRKQGVFINDPKQKT